MFCLLLRPLTHAGPPRRRAAGGGPSQPGARGRSWEGPTLPRLDPPTLHHGGVEQDTAAAAVFLASERQRVLLSTCEVAGHTQHSAAEPRLVVLDFCSVTDTPGREENKNNSRALLLAVVFSLHLSSVSVVGQEVDFRVPLCVPHRKIEVTGPLCLYFNGFHVVGESLSRARAVQCQF